MVTNKTPGGENFGKLRSHFEDFSSENAPKTAWNPIFRACGAHFQSIVSVGARSAPEKKRALHKAIPVSNDKIR